VEEKSKPSTVKKGK